MRPGLYSRPNGNAPAFPPGARFLPESEQIGTRQTNWELEKNRRKFGDVNQADLQKYATSQEECINESNLAEGYVWPLTQEFNEF